MTDAEAWRNMYSEVHKERLSMAEQIVALERTVKQ